MLSPDALLTWPRKLLLVSTAVSISVTMLFTWRKVGGHEVQKRLGTMCKHPAEAAKCYKLMWLCTKGGLTVLLASAIARFGLFGYVPQNWRHGGAYDLTVDTSRMVLVVIALTLGLASIVTNELARV